MLSIENILKHCWLKRNAFLFHQSFVVIQRAQIKFQQAKQKSCLQSNCYNETPFDLQEEETIEACCVCENVNLSIKWEWCSLDLWKIGGSKRVQKHIIQMILISVPIRIFHVFFLYNYTLVDFLRTFRQNNFMDAFF